MCILSCFFTPDATPATVSPQPGRMARGAALSTLVIFSMVLIAADRPPVEPGPFHRSELVELSRLDSSFHLDIRYATTNNFIGRAVYTEPRAFLQRPAAEALARVQRSLKKQGFGLVIFDGYRPWRVTKIFWEAMPADKKQFVADPSLGSVHSRGCAVDLTLRHLKNGSPARMPSEFDEWTERSRIDYPGGSADSRRLRDLLCREMEAEGFLRYELEWWHYTWKDWDQYAVEDLLFPEIPVPREDPMKGR